MRRVLALALLTLAPSPALAGPAPAPAPPPAAPALPALPSLPSGPGSGDCARAHKAGRPCELTIEPEQVGGDRPTPDGIDLRVRPFLPAGSLLRLRRDFVAEIVKSADDL